MEEPRKPKTLGVLLTYPMDPYLESELAARFRLFRFWQVSPSRRASFLNSNSDSIDAVVCGTAAGGGADAGMIDLLPRLGLVATFSVGHDNVDLEKCREREVRVVNTPDVLTDDVADLAIGLAIGVLRRLCSAERLVREEARMGEFELTSKFSGKSVGIVGLGRIGMATAKRAEAFGCPVSYSSRSEKQGVGYRYFPSVLELASSSQILVVSCPLTAETYHIINREVIEALGKTGVLINIGRGSIVDEKELVSALLDGRLGGAGLDVFEREPEPPVELFALENVVLAPHVGSSTLETCKDMADLVIRNLEAFAVGNPLSTPVL